MSFQRHLDELLNKGKAKLQEFTDSHSSNSGGPPPINYSSKPGGAAPPPQYSSQPSNVYWQPTFHPTTLVSSLFKQETGAHGWGNNESQNYTASDANCFFTPDNKLILRGIVSTSSPTDKYTSARLVSHQRLERERGCLTVLLSAPCAEGVWPAFWLLPAEPFTWPHDGEVDIFESWNGDCVNHACLHWGFFNGEDWDKHRVVETPIPSLPHQPHEFAFAWEQGAGGKGGRAVWYIDGQPVMKAGLPETTRRISDYKIIMNVAMGGNVCQGRLPRDGTYDLVVHHLRLMDEPAGGWGKFGSDWERTKEGRAG